MTEAHRSGCPINLPLEVFGGKGGLLVLRDIILPRFSVTIRCAIVGSVWSGGLPFGFLLVLSRLLSYGSGFSLICFSRQAWCEKPIEQ